MSNDATIHEDITPSEAVKLINKPKPLFGTVSGSYVLKLVKKNTKYRLESMPEESDDRNHIDIFEWDDQLKISFYERNHGGV